MKLLFKTLLIIYLISGFLFPDKESFFTAFESISANNIQHHLEILASDSLEGAVGTKGAEIAANYISNSFSNLK
jgi:hypothetical protein